ncbi:MAG: transporter substrate-binding domain-containing protein [Emcibacteraceae bacterium]|nr:transporter substrate-binding domain-containing protein [Emcibacteraceae bacterium]
MIKFLSYLCIMVLCIGTVHAQHSLLDDIVEKKVIRIGTTGDYGPFSYMSDKTLEQFNGLDIELAKDLAQSLNVDVEFVHTTWGTLMNDLLDDKFDVGMSGISINLARQRQAMFSSMIMSGGKAAISRDADADKYKTIAAINQPHVRVIVNPGGTNEQFTRQNFPDAQLILNDDNITIFQKIVDGDADIMVTDAIETIIQEQVHSELEAVNPNAPFNYTEKGYLFKRDVAFKTYIDQWLNLLLKDGTVKKIKNAQITKYVALND